MARKRQGSRLCPYLMDKALRGLSLRNELIHPILICEFIYIYKIFLFAVSIVVNTEATGFRRTL